MSGPRSVEELKAAWLRDPSWDIEDTEGFEGYRDHLREFAEAHRARWAEEAGARERTRSDHQVLVSIAQLQTEILTELQHIRTALNSSARSSVELAENAKGAVQITVKTYVDCAPVDDACIEAVAGFRTLKKEVERGMMEGWRETIEQLQRERAS